MVLLSCLGEAGLETIINDMTDNKIDKKNKIKKVIELLKFVLTLDDPELTKSTVESVIETLEEINNE